jgi:hypothetical protein
LQRQQISRHSRSELAQTKNPASKTGLILVLAAQGKDKV